MPLDYSVHFQAKLQKALVARLRHNRTLLTFVPTGDLVAGFTELALAVTASNWKVLLKARGGKETDLIWIALSKFFAPAFEAAGATAPNPARAAQVPDKIVIGRRTNAEPTKWTATVTGGLDGVYTIGAYGFGEVSFEADTNTAAEIRDALGDAWNLLTALAAVSTAADNGVAAVDITTDTDGFPFEVYVTSTGSPITLVNATAEGDYEADLDALMPVVLDATTNPPLKVEDAVYFIHDLQWDDQTNRQGTEWCIAQKVADGRRTYVCVEESYHPSIPLANVTNDPASTLKTLLTPLSEESNDRGVIVYKTGEWDFYACKWLGRCSGYNLGAINWAQRELSGAVPMDLGDNEVVATIKYFNFLSPESPRGNMKWGYLGSGRFIDDLWAEDILSYEGQTALLTLLVSEDALDYTDEGGIASGSGVIEQRLTKYQGPNYPYLVPDSIVITAGKAADQSGDDKEKRTFVDYTVAAVRRNLINRYGDEPRPITLTISV